MSVLSQLNRRHLRPLIPSNVGYKTNVPLSSHTALVHIAGMRPSGPGISSSLSTASRLPNSMSSTRWTDVLACCISWIAFNDSSYFRVSLPVRKENMRIWRSGRENVTNEDESGERVMQAGFDLAWKKVRGGCTMGWLMYLFELVEVCGGFE